MGPCMCSAVGAAVVSIDGMSSSELQPPNRHIKISSKDRTPLLYHHASSRAIAAKAFRAGFYWLTAIEDAKDIVRKCEACQLFS
jgi:hypothetical protein